MVRTLTRALAFLLCGGLAAAIPNTHAAAAKPASAVAEGWSPARTVADLGAARDAVVTTKGGRVLAVQVFAPAGRAPNKMASLRSIAGMGTEVIVLWAGGAPESAVAPVVDMLRHMQSTVVVVSGRSSLNVNEARPLRPLPEELHALITWAGAGVGRPISVFGMGDGADIALRVGAARSKDLVALIVDGVSGPVATRVVSKLQTAPSSFRGALVMASGEEEEAQPVVPPRSRLEFQHGSVRLAASGLSAATVVQNPSYARVIARMLGATFTLGAR